MAKATAKKDDPLSVGRHSGENIFGYEVHKDGSITLSPHHIDKIRQQMAREAGLEFLMKSVSSYVAKEAEECGKLGQQFWAEFRKDTGAPGKWLFDYATGKIRPATDPNDNQ